MATLISKAFTSLANSIRKASTGTLSNYVINSPPEWGQPMITPGDASGLITPERMREIVRKTPTVAACINAISDYCANVGLLVKHQDPANPVPDWQVNLIEDLLENPNPNDTQRQFMSALIYDLSILGYAAIEVEQNGNGYPAQLHMLDGARVRQDFDEHGTILGYDMLDAHGIPIRGSDGVHAWRPDQIIYFKRDSNTQSKYPESRLTQLFSCAVVEDMMLNFIGGKFTESNIPYGIYDMGDISDVELKTAITHWNNQAKSNHRILLTGSRGKSTFTHFGYALKDLEATALLAEVRMKIMGILGVTMNELGESQDVNKSNGYSLSYTFKRRAIEPILHEICGTLSRRLLSEAFGFKRLKLYFEEIDSRDELLQAQIDEINMKNGFITHNQIRNRRGDPRVAGGDEPYVVIGTNAVPVALLRRFAEAQLAAIEAEVQMALAGGGNIKPPANRGPQSPIKQNVPDGVGSSQVKISYENKSQTPSSQAARGPVEIGRQQGHRND